MQKWASISRKSAIYSVIYINEYVVKGIKFDDTKSRN